MILNESNFEETIKNNELVLIDIWATWCPPCIAMNPVMEAIENENKDIVVGKVNIDENGWIGEKYGVAAIPCFLFFKDGKQVARLAGNQTKETLLAKFKEV